MEAQGQDEAQGCISRRNPAEKILRGNTPQILLTTSTDFNSPVRAGQQTTPGCSQMTLLPPLGLTQFSFLVFPHINLPDAVPNNPS